MNGWLVPPGEPSKTADILFDFYMGNIELARPGRIETGRPRKDSLHFNDNGRLTAFSGIFSLSDIETSRSASPTSYEDSNPAQKPLPSVTPNEFANRYVSDIGAPFPAVHPDESSPSEDYFTIGENIRASCHRQRLTLLFLGNAARWLLIISLMSGRSASADHHSARQGGNGEEDVNMLESMGLSRNGSRGGREAFQQYNDQVVWKMLMGDDIEEGEGRIILHDQAVDFVPVPDNSRKDAGDDTLDHGRVHSRDHVRDHTHGHRGGINGKNRK